MFITISRTISKSDANRFYEDVILNTDHIIWIKRVSILEGGQGWHVSLSDGKTFLAKVEENPEFNRLACTLEKGRENDAFLVR